MANPSVTYTFTNGTTADATQVNQNFTDLINGLTDGTKSLTIDALTAGGTATFNGSVVLGNGSVDDLTIGASLASTVAVKTTDSYDFGSSTIGMRSLYLGSSAGAFTTRFKGAAVASSYTYTTPLTSGSDGDGVVGIGSGSTQFFPLGLTPGYQANLGLESATASAAGDSIKVTSASGSDLSSTNQLYVCVGHATAGLKALLKATADVTLTPTGAHWERGGLGNRTDQRLFVYAINDAGTLKWGLSPLPGLRVILGANDETTATNCTTIFDVFVNSALTGDSNCVEVGSYLADFNDTGDIWTTQTGVGEILVGAFDSVLWQRYTGGASGIGTLGTNEFWFAKIGECMSLRGKAITGTTAASEAQLNLPSGGVIKTIGITTQIQPVGVIQRQGTDSIPSLIMTEGDSFLNVGSGTNRLAALNGSSVFNNTETLGWDATGIPIVGW